MKTKILLAILFVLVVVVSGCAQQTNQGQADKTMGTEQLGSICSSEESCVKICFDSRGMCESYCKNNKDNLLCQKLYPSLITPKEKPVLILPFAREDNAENIIPMGETITHHGEPHVGIDFAWSREVKIRASLAGNVVFLAQREAEEAHEGVWDVYVKTGKYVIGYTELSFVNPEVYLGKKVGAGEWVGDNWESVPADNHWNIHWEFGYYPEGWEHMDYAKPYPDRLCPMNYFDADSKQRIEQIWARTAWDYKKDFPHICSGIFYGKYE